jgi:mono/diheme cytochrome c family protein
MSPLIPHLLTFAVEIAQARPSSALQELLPITVVCEAPGESWGKGGSMHRAITVLVGLSMLELSALVLSGRPLMAEDFASEEVQAGSSLYSRNCAICHGQHMQNPDEEVGAFDLRQFPHDQHDRFVASVSQGKNAMPAWGGVLRPAEVEALWAYVCEGEK